MQSNITQFFKKIFQQPINRNFRNNDFIDAALLFLLLSQLPGADAQNGSMPSNISSSTGDSSLANLAKAELAAGEFAGVFLGCLIVIVGIIYGSFKIMEKCRPLNAQEDNAAGINEPAEGVQGDFQALDNPVPERDGNERPEGEPIQPVGVGNEPGAGENDHEIAFKEESREDREREVVVQQRERNMNGPR